jgi:SpoVK/Ycf46/Vps4 family AAA+-type ATPase
MVCRFSSAQQQQQQQQQQQHIQGMVGRTVGLVAAPPPAAEEAAAEEEQEETWLEMETMEDVLDLLSQLLETAGLVVSPPHENDDKEDDATTHQPWNTLADALEELATLQPKVQKREDNSMHDNKEDLQLLLQLEEAMRNVRDAAGDLSHWLPRELQLQLDRCHQLTQLCGRKTIPLLALFQSLENALRQQQAAAYESLQSIQSWLTTLYHEEDDDPQQSSLPTLPQLARRIRQRCIPKSSASPPWSTALSLLQALAEHLSSSSDETTTMFDGIRDSPTVAFDLPLPPLPSELYDISIQPRLSFSAAPEDMIEDTPLQRQILSGYYRTFLLVGPEGSGKTFQLNQLATVAKSRGIQVLWPFLPLDTLGATVGAAEDALLSMMAYLMSSTRNANNMSSCILLLDDIDVMLLLGSDETTNNNEVVGTTSSIAEPHSTARLQSLFLTLLDTINATTTSNDFIIRKATVICTSKSASVGGTLGRFDQVFHMGLPSDAERRRILVDSWGGDKDEAFGSSTLLDSVVECSAGLSRSELAQLCRQSLLLTARLSTMNHTAAAGASYLETIKMQLQSSKPASLQQQQHYDIDMKVYSARDLQQQHHQSWRQQQNDELPLFGDTAKQAWNELQRWIVLPLCQGAALNELLYYNNNNHNNTNNHKVFAGGVLLASPPGTGKSQLAYACAAHASRHNPRVTLLDVSCTSLIRKEVGGSERALHQVFAAARAAAATAPCIVILDGIDTIAAVRGNDTTTEGTMDRLLSTLLTELDGVDDDDNNPSGYGGGGDASLSSSSCCMTVIGITHNAKWIDPALLRPGRLGRVVSLGNPDGEARRQILLRELGGDGDEMVEKLEMDDVLDTVAKETDGFTGAQVVAVCNEAKLRAFQASLKKEEENGADTPTTHGDPCMTRDMLLQAVREQHAGSSTSSGSE